MKQLTDYMDGFEVGAPERRQICRMLHYATPTPLLAAYRGMNVFTWVGTLDGGYRWAEELHTAIPGPPSNNKGIKDTVVVAHGAGLASWLGDTDVDAFNQTFLSCSN